MTLAVVFAVSELSAVGQNIPTTWLTVEQAAFSFRVPPDMTNQLFYEAGTSPIPACVNSNIVLTFAYYADPGWAVSRPRSGVKQTITAIDGHAAQVQSYQMVQPFFLNEGKTNVIRLYAKDGTNALNMVTYCFSEGDYAVSERIFKSVRFKKK